MHEQPQEHDEGPRSESTPPDRSAAGADVRPDATARDSSSDVAIEALRRSTARVRRNGERLHDVHEQLQSTASRVQALRETARSLGEEIARTRDAVDNTARELNE